MTIDILAGFHNEFSAAVDAVSGIAGHLLSAEMEEEHQAVAKEVAKAFDGIAEKKTEQVHTIITVMLIPIGLIIGAFLIKMAYDFFTGAADKVGKGVGSISSKLKATVAEAVKPAPDKKSQSSGKLSAMPKDPSKAESRPRLLGEVIIRFVNASLTAREVEDAVRSQKQSNNGKRIGEILIERGVVTSDDVQRALKIQKKT